MIIDLLACLVVALGLYQGYSSGIIKTVFATVSIIVAIVATMKLSHFVIDALQRSININKGILFVLGFVLTFMTVIIIIRFIGKKMESVFESLEINFINKISGAAVLGLFYAILFSYAVFFMDRVSLISDQQKAVSFSYPMLKPLPAMTVKYGKKLEPTFRGLWNSFIETMDDIKAKGDEMQDDN